MKTKSLVSAITLAILAPLGLSAGEVSDLVKTVGPAVAVIKTADATPAGKRSRDHRPMHGIGSGVLISEYGKVLTAAHVVHLASEILVEFADGHKSKARVLRSSPQADLALLQLQDPPADITPAKLADSSTTEIGDQICVIGAPYGLSHTLSVGHISARRNDSDVMDGLGEIEIFLIDAAVNQGNSGGPVFNMAGEVIGVVSAILSKSGGFDGIGVAITSDTAQQLFLEKRAFWSGMTGILVKNELAAALNVPQSGGYLVQRVVKDSPAGDMGIKGGNVPVTIKGRELLLGGDIILEVGGVKVTDDRESLELIRDYINGLKTGARLEATVLRNGKTLTVSTIIRPD